MKIELKVYGMSAGTRRRIIAASSRAAAARALGITNYTAREYMSETGNPDELRIAQSEPGVVFSQPNRAFSRHYEREDNGVAT